MNVNQLALVCRSKHTIHLLQLGDNINATFETIVTNGDNELYRPRVVAMDNEGSILVADREHNRIQLHQAGKWQTIQIEPQPDNPRGAVHINDTMFVTGRKHDSYYIYKYTGES